MMYKAKRDGLQIGMKSGISLNLFKVVVDIKKIQYVHWKQAH